MRTFTRWIMVAGMVSSCSAPQAPFDEAAAIARGGEITKSTFQHLSTRLQGAMAEEGPVGALRYCAVAALPLVDTLSAVHGVRIKRTSDRIRAPWDMPDADEQRQLNEVLAKLAQGVKPMDLPAQALVLGDSIAYYQPILISMPTCLKCHGTPGLEVDEATMALLAERYPGDAATGYAVGDLRGLWSIRWKR